MSALDDLKASLAEGTISREEYDNSLPAALLSMPQMLVPTAVADEAPAPAAVNVFVPSKSHEKLSRKRSRSSPVSIEMAGPVSIENKPLSKSEVDSTDQYSCCCPEMYFKTLLCVMLHAFHYWLETSVGICCE